MIRDIIQSFLPWIIYSLLASKSQQELAIYSALGVFFWFDKKSLKKGFILSWGTLLFFIFLLLTVVVMKNNWISNHAWIFANGALAMIAWGSLLIGQPFTAQYAKAQVKPEHWDSKPFVRINQILTGTWGCIFLLCMWLQILKIYFPEINHWIYEVASDGATVFGIWFSAWFPNWYRHRTIILS